MARTSPLLNKVKVGDELLYYTATNPFINLYGFNNSTFTTFL